MKAWSHSALTSFETCPKKHYLTNIAKKFQEPPSDAMEEGKKVHSMIENYVKKGTPFPLGYSHFEEMVTKVMPRNASQYEIITETQLALSADFRMVGWFAKNVWVRSIIDYGVIHGGNALIVDWKTGKRKKNDDQLALMSAMVMVARPDLHRVTTAFCWTNTGEIDKSVFVRADLDDIWSRFDHRVEHYQKAFAEEDFPARPSGLCKKYCPVTSCAYHGI